MLRCIRQRLEADPDTGDSHFVAPLAFMANDAGNRGFVIYFHDTDPHPLPFLETRARENKTPVLRNVDGDRAFDLARVETTRWGQQEIEVDVAAPCGPEAAGRSLQTPLPGQVLKFTIALVLAIKQRPNTARSFSPG